MWSSPTTPDVCHCAARWTDDVFGVFIRQEMTSSNTGAMLTAVVPGLAKFSPLQTTQDVGPVPGKTDSVITYSIDGGAAVPLMETVQNVSVCRGGPTTITVCAPSTRLGTVLRISAFGQTTTSSSGGCVHIMDVFPFHTSASTHQVTFSYDEGAGCPFNDEFVFNLREKTDGCPLPTTCASTAYSRPREPAALTSHGIQVLCDTETEGGGWVIIQRRTSRDLNFTRGWDDYVAGFGNKTGDHWLGLQAIHSLCPPSKPCGLRVDMDDKDTPGRTWWAEYTSFSVLELAADFRLSLSGYNTSSTAGDAMLIDVDRFRNNNMAFTTYDRHNDMDGEGYNCTHTSSGGWWYNGCGNARLNSQEAIWTEHTCEPHLCAPSEKPIYPIHTEMKVRLHV